MPVVLCPECTGKLKIPDDLPLNTQLECPSCTAQFLAKEVRVHATNQPFKPIDAAPSSSKKSVKSESVPSGRSTNAQESSKKNSKIKQATEPEDEESTEEETPRLRSRRKASAKPRRKVEVRRDDSEEKPVDYVPQRIFLPQLDRAAQGLQLVYSGVMMMLISLSITLVLFLMLLSKLRFPDTVYNGAGIAALGCWLLALIGNIVCVFGPQKKGALILAVITLVLGLVHFLVILRVGDGATLGGDFPGVKRDQEEGTNLFAMCTRVPFMVIVGLMIGLDAKPEGSFFFAMFLEILYLFFFCIYLKQITRHSQNPIATNSTDYLVVGWFCIPGALVMYGMVAFILLKNIGSKTALDIVAFGTVIIIHLAAWGLYAWTLQMIYRTREGILDYFESV